MRTAIWTLSLMVVVGTVLGSGAAAIHPRGVVHAAVDPAIAAQAPQQLERGKTVFATVCAECHGDSGEGSGDNPRLIGAPNRMATYQTALRLFQFVVSEMPPDRPKTLKPEDYWDVVAFLLSQNKLLPDNTVLGPDNAANIRTAP
jgi:mono/diheme cytochrome c family protein